MFMTSNRALLALFASVGLASCFGNSSNSSSQNFTPDPPINQAPSADISASAVSVEERQAFTLSASGSTDPDGDTLTYQWNQTAGAAVAIANPTQADLSLTMPETQADDTLQFTLQVSDGSLSDTTTVDITLANIVLAPLNTDFQPVMLDDASAVKMPTNLNVRRYNILAGSFCDGGYRSVYRIDILGQNGSGQRAIGEWNGSGSVLDVSSIAGAPVSTAGFLTSLTYPFTRSCVDPFGGGGGRGGGSTFTQSNAVATVHFPDDNTVFQKGLDQKIDDQTDVCAARGVYDRNGQFLHYLTAETTGGIDSRPVTVDANGVLTLGAATTLVASGDFCQFWTEGRQSYSSGTVARTNLFAVDKASKELVMYRSQETQTLTQFTEIERITLPDSSGTSSNIVAVDFYSPLSFRGIRSNVYAAVILSDGQHRGVHRLLIYENDIAGSFITPDDYQGFTLTTDIALSGGIPKAIELTTTGVSIISDTVPYIEHIDCNGGVCDEATRSYIEVGFDVADIAALNSAIMVSKPDDDEVQAFTR